MPEPTPGSQEARDLGCKCPVLDNGHGRGSWYGDGIFIYSGDCPVHAPQFKAASEAYVPPRFSRPRRTEEKRDG